MHKFIILLMTVAAVATEEVTKNETKPVLPEPKNAFKFEDQPDTPQSYGLIRFEGNNEKYGIYNGLDKDHGHKIKFEEDNKIENQRPNHQKKKRRRRRPKQRFPNVQGESFSGPGSGPVFPGGYPAPIYAGQRPYPQTAYPGQFYKPRPSTTSAALSAVTEALTSIALYDDRQCVPRLLCEAAGGAGAGVAGAGAGGLLQAVSGMQPLLTLLAAYNGISSSPLFVFGRAVFLGMTSKANPGTCRYAYPDCPNDPEQLVHYLNNHNGGFFRFFAGSQQNQQQQGLEQFYNQLSGQNNGYYQPQNLQQFGYGQLQQQNYQNLQQFGQIQPGYPNQDQQGLYHQQNSQSSNLQQFSQIQQGYPNQNQQGPYHYGLFQQQNFGNFQNSGHQRPSLYGNGYGYYGNGYPYQQINNNRFKNNEIQKRIQNTRSVFTSNNNVGTRWQFPEDSSANDKETYSNVRLGKVLKFPQSNVNHIIAADGFIFPGVQSNREYIINNIEAEDDNRFKFDNPTAVNNYRLVNDNFVKDDTYFGNDDVRTLYIVRGNGDPKHPEIVHLAPGQTL